MTIPDDPAGIEDDLLNISPVAEIFANRLSKSESPITMGIHGLYGSGKTSFMNMIHQHLEKISNKEKKKYYSVKINCWKYSEKDALCRVIILSLLEKIENIMEGENKNNDNISKNGKNKGKKTEENVKNNQYNIENKEDINKIRERLYRSFESESKGNLELDYKNLLSIAFKFIFPRFLVFFNFKSKNDKIEKKVIEFEDVIGIFRRRIIKEHQRRISNIEEFQNKFKELVRYITKKNGFMVVYLDDLDRCLPERIVEVFEAIKLFVGVENSHFIIGVDHKLVIEGIKNKYCFKNNLNGNSEKRWMYEYLNKVIQIPYSLPKPRYNELEKFFDKYDKNDEFKDYRRIILTTIDPNPRKIKLIMNILSLDFEIFNKGITKSG
jgi:predicted KAP-like P-loop ATPase